MDASLVVEADLVIDDEVVPLAGDDHVVVAVGPELHRPLQLAGGERRDAGEEIGLGLLAAEPAAHAPHLDGDGMGGDAQHLRHHVLHLAGMLRRGEDLHVLLLAGDGERNLAFEVEMILPADRHRALEPARTFRQRGRDIAPFELERVGHQRAAGRTGRRDIEHRRGLLIDRLRQHRRLPRRRARLRDHGEERLAVMQDRLRREDRLVMAMRRGDVVGARNIGRRQHRDHAGRRQHGREIERHQPPMGDAAETKIGVQQPLRRSDVVDIDGFARDMAGGGIVDARRSDHRGGFLVEPAARISHGRPPRVGRPRASRYRVASSRSGTASAGCLRPSAGSRPRPACR